MTSSEWLMLAGTLALVVSAFIATGIAAHIKQRQDRQRYADYLAAEAAAWGTADPKDPRTWPPRTRWG